MYRIMKGNSIEDNAFESIADFQDCMRHGGEVVFSDKPVRDWRRLRLT